MNETTDHWDVIWHNALNRNDVTYCKNHKSTLLFPTSRIPLNELSGSIRLNGNSTEHLALLMPANETETTWTLTEQWNLPSLDKSFDKRPARHWTYWSIFVIFEWPFFFLCGPITYDCSMTAPKNNMNWDHHFGDKFTGGPTLKRELWNSKMAGTYIPLNSFHQRNLCLPVHRFRRSTLFKQKTRKEKCKLEYSMAKDRTMQHRG